MEPTDAPATPTASSDLEDGTTETRVPGEDAPAAPKKPRRDPHVCRCLCEACGAAHPRPVRGAAKTEEEVAAEKQRVNERRRAWYQANKAAIQEKKKQRYQSDEQYRAKKNEASRQRYKNNDEYRHRRLEVAKQRRAAKPISEIVIPPVDAAPTVVTE